MILQIAAGSLSLRPSWLLDAHLTQWVLPRLQLEMQEAQQHLRSADLRLFLPGLSCTNIPSRVAPGSVLCTSLLLFFPWDAFWDLSWFGLWWEGS